MQQPMAWGTPSPASIRLTPIPSGPMPGSLQATRAPTAELNGLAPGSDIIRARNAAGEARTERYRRSTVAAALAAPELFLQDARDALEHVPRDLARGVPVWQAVSKDDRLRGLGVLLVGSGLAGLVLAAMVM